MELVNILYRNLAVQIMQFVEDPATFLALRAIYHAARQSGVPGKEIFQSIALAASKAFTPEAVAETVTKHFPETVPDAVAAAVEAMPKAEVKAETAAVVETPASV